MTKLKKRDNLIDKFNSLLNLLANIFIETQDRYKINHEYNWYEGGNKFFKRFGVVIN